MRASPEALQLGTSNSLGPIEIADLIKARNEVFDPSQANHLSPRNSAPQAPVANMDPVSRMLAGAEITAEARAAAERLLRAATA